MPLLGSGIAVVGVREPLLVWVDFGSAVRLTSPCQPLGAKSWAWEDIVGEGGVIDGFGHPVACSGGDYLYVSALDVNMWHIVKH
jgi:hypothetical protein